MEVFTGGGWSQGKLKDEGRNALFEGGLGGLGGGEGGNSVQKSLHSTWGCATNIDCKISPGIHPLYFKF